MAGAGQSGCDAPDGCEGRLGPLVTTVRPL